jgi:hypothetical protein
MKTDSRNLRTLAAFLRANPNITSLEITEAGIKVTQQASSPVTAQLAKRVAEESNNIDHQFDKDLAEWEKMMDEGMTN